VTVREEHHTQPTVVGFGDATPTAEPPVGLDVPVFGDGGGAKDPLQRDAGAVRALASG